jgi:hypothetical protein
LLRLRGIKRCLGKLTLRLQQGVIQLKKGIANRDGFPLLDEHCHYSPG